MTDDVTHVVLDTETTGWSPDKGDRVIEIAAAVFDPVTGKLGKTFHEYVNPGLPIEAQATAIHGITNEMLADKPPFEAIADGLIEFVRGTRVIIHNATFDTRFLNSEMKKAKREKFEEFPEQIVCSRRLARAVLPPSQSAKLDDLCDLFGVDRSIRTLHGALVDVSLLAQVYPHLRAKKAERDAVLASLLPFAPGAELPDDIDKLGIAYTLIGQLVSQLQAEQERIKSTMRSLLGGVNYEHRDFTVTFGLPGKRTDWEKVRAKYLQGVDLSEYQKDTEAPMIIKAT